jgi:hypothetical protein
VVGEQYALAWLQLFATPCIGVVIISIGHRIVGELRG